MTAIAICEELKVLAGNNLNTVLQVLKFTFLVGGCLSKGLIENASRRLEEVLMDPGWSALVCVSIDILVWCCGQGVAKLELNLVPEMYLGRLSSPKILSYKWGILNTVEHCRVNKKPIYGFFRSSESDSSNNFDRDLIVSAHDMRTGFSV